ncbi:MAG: D-alanyl-D-alanine carboxypeptidase/D-alanyl-D-alanine-endopeptidase [Acidimicrobiia bacterium]|nr:D-alanyl-D-alanine carboxypeptidase/D-alanyl-D-alanine-endopeptidase [Acidimicrobiia bacterium]
MTGRLVAAGLAVLAVVAAVVAAWPSPRHGPSAQGAVAAPVLDAARVPVFVSQTAANVRLGQRLDAVLAGHPQSCLTVDDSRGPTLYSQRGDLPLMPASNLKLLTATAVLARLGGTGRFQTEVRAAHPPVNGVIAGDVWLVGAGDPLLATADYAAQAGYQHQPRPRTPLEELATKLAAAGIRQVQGRILGDESRYDTQRVVPTWSPTYLADGEVGPMSALTVNDNEAAWAPKEVPAPAPATNAANVLAHLLQQHGVQVGGTGEGVAPAGAAVLAAADSAPMADVVGATLTQSDNLAAELLTKELGKRFGGAGTTAAGLSVTKAVLDEQHMPDHGVVMTDGSGLDRSDRATCQVLLDAVEQGGPSGTIARGLPVAGSTGTLFHRYVGSPLAGRLRAKTGTLNGVAAFTGWLVAGQGRQVAFSYLVNGIGSEAEGRALEDRVATALNTYPEAPPPASLTGSLG